MDRLIEQGRLPVDEALAIALEVGRAMVDQAILQRWPGHELHDQKRAGGVFANVGHADDTRRRKRGSEHRLAAETRGVFGIMSKSGVQNLDRYRAVGPQINGAIDGS